MKKLLAIGLSTLSLNVMAADITVDELKAIGYETIGLKNHTVYLVTDHFASVTNNTNQVQYITVYYSICADNKGCDTSHHYKIKLIPYGHWQDGIRLSISPNYVNAGHFKVIATTRVVGNGINQQAQGYGSVTIR